MADIFYEHKHLSREDKKHLMKYAELNCTSYHVDILNCNISWSRQSTLIKFENIIKIFDNSCHFVIINRLEEQKGEIGFSTMIGDTHYYLFIYVSLDTLDDIIRKYKLKKKDE